MAWFLEADSRKAYMWLISLSNSRPGEPVSQVPQRTGHSEQRLRAIQPSDPYLVSFIEASLDASFLER